MTKQHLFLSIYFIKNTIRNLYQVQYNIQVKLKASTHIIKFKKEMLEGMTI